MNELARIEPPSTEVVTTTTTDPTGGRLVAWAESLRAAHQIGAALCNTSFVPRHFQGKPEDAAAAILFGDEIGFTPTQALRSIHVISGTPGLYARSMVALVQSHGHEVWTDTDTPTKVVVCGRRRGSKHVEKSEWTIDRARRAGYTSNKKYETDPQAMLYARASSDVCRKVASDVLAGVAFSVEELELEGARTGTTKRTVRRAELPQREEPELELEPETQTKGAEPEPKAEEQPDPAVESPLLNTSSALAKRMFASLGDAGITDKEERLAYVSRVTGREVTTSKEMTDADADAVISALAADAVAKDQPAEPTFDDQEPKGWGNNR